MQKQFQAKSSKLSIEEKYVHALKKSGRKGEGTVSNKTLKERNVFQDILSCSGNDEFSKSKMAAVDAIDDEIIFQKEIQKKYIGNMHDN